MDQDGNILEWMTKRKKRCNMDVKKILEQAVKMDASDIFLLQEVHMPLRSKKKLSNRMMFD